MMEFEKPGKAYGILRRICAAVFASMLLVIASGIALANFGDGLSIPLRGSNKFVILGMALVGGLFGALFPKPFGWLFNIFSGFSFGSN